MEHEGDEELIHPQPPRRHLGVVVGRQTGGEGRTIAAGCGGAHLAANDMVPDRQSVVSEVAPRLVQLEMPVVQIADVGRLETGARDLEHHHERPAVEGDDVVVHMTRIGEVGPNLGLTAQARSRDDAVSHGPAPRADSAGRPGGARRNCRPTVRCCGSGPWCRHRPATA